MNKLKKGQTFLAAVLALAMMVSMSIPAFADGGGGSSAAGEYIVAFYDGGIYKTTATYTYNEIGVGLPDCGEDGWQFNVYRVNDEDGTEVLVEGYSYTSSADNNVVTEELMDMLSGSVDVGSVGYTLQYNAYTNREESGGSSDVSKNIMSSQPNMQDSFFEAMGFASAVSAVDGGNSKYFSEGAAVPERTVYWFLNQTEELNAYADKAGCVDISYSGDYGIIFLYGSSHYMFDNHLCYAADQEVTWETAYDGSSAYDYEAGK